MKRPKQTQDESQMSTALKKMIEYDRKHLQWGWWYDGQKKYWKDSDCDGVVARMFNGLETTQCDVVQKLSLYCRGLFHVPIGICRLKTLQYLYLGSNRLTEIPLWLCKMTTLEWLDLEDNDISRLPMALARLTRLKTLTCDENAKLPPHLQVRIVARRFLVQDFLRPFRCALRCQSIATAMLGTYRQWRRLRLPRDMVRMLARMVWDMRNDSDWE